LWWKTSKEDFGRVVPCAQAIEVLDCDRELVVSTSDEPEDGYARLLRYSQVIPVKGDPGSSIVRIFNSQLVSEDVTAG